MNSLISGFIYRKFLPFYAQDVTVCNNVVTPVTSVTPRVYLFAKYDMYIRLII